MFQHGEESCIICQEFYWRLESDKKQKLWTWLTGSLIVPFIAWTPVTFLFIFPFQLLNFAMAKETNSWNLFSMGKNWSWARAQTISVWLIDFDWDCPTLCLCVFILALLFQRRKEVRCSISSQYLAFPLTRRGRSSRDQPHLQYCSPLPPLWKLSRKNLWRKFRASRK